MSITTILQHSELTIGQFLYAMGLGAHDIKMLETDIKQDEIPPLTMDGMMTGHKGKYKMFS